MRVPSFMQHLQANAAVPAHCHRKAYVAVVIRGSYHETGDGGRHQAEAGEVRIHQPFTLHSDRVGTTGASIVNLALTLDQALALRSGCVPDPEWLVAAAASEDFDLVSYLQEVVRETEPNSDLPDLLARDLEKPGGMQLEHWADLHGLAPRSMRRQFRKAFGMTPAHYRWRAKARGAWSDVMSTRTALAAIAADWGFSDQAHLGRSIRQLTGFPPKWWRDRREVLDPVAV